MSQPPEPNENPTGSDNSEPHHKIPPNVKAARDALRGQPSSQGESKDSKFRGDDIFPLSKAYQKKAAEKREIGKLYPGKGIYLGQWHPGEISKSFNLFAAPENMTPTMFFNAAVAATMDLRNWHGHDGLNHRKTGKTEEGALWEVLASGSYKGEWFIPPVALLKDYLMKHRTEKALAESLGPERQPDFWFHSCSCSNDVSHFLVSLNLLSGTEASYDRWEHDAKVRLMRAEPI